GLYRSVDGGAHWQRVLATDPNAGASDVEIDPQNPNVVYAGMWESRMGPWEDNNFYEGTHGGLYKSVDGGSTWTKLTRGLPADVMQADIAIAPSRPSRLYVTVGTSEKAEYATSKGSGLFRSDDAGASWVKVTDDPRPMMKIGGGDLMAIVV